MIINDGLEEIGRGVFQYCSSLERIIIPNAVKRIKKYAFSGCVEMMTVTLGEGLKEIGEHAFERCESLQRIIIHNAVKRIKNCAFLDCSGMTSVTFGEGLEEIGAKAFERCTSLKHIYIPPNVKKIHTSTFKSCSNLNHVQFRDEIEEFVSCEAMREWWNRGLHEKSLSTYCFLVNAGFQDSRTFTGSWLSKQLAVLYSPYVKKHTYHLCPCRRQL